MLSSSHWVLLVAVGPGGVFVVVGSGVEVAAWQTNKLKAIAAHRGRVWLTSDRNMHRWG